MDLLDRYLQAVRKHLPWKRQDDILAELRANLESQLEEHEEALGRPLTQTEAEAWLKEIGPPMQVAARYLPQQYLIGPTIFPTYWWVIRTVMLWGFAIMAIVTAVRIMVSGFDIGSAHGLPGLDPAGTAILESTVQALLNIPFALMQIAAWVTLTFAAIEFAVARGLASWPSVDAFTGDWPPNKLPPLERSIAPRKKPRSRSQAIAEVVLGVMLIIWLPLIPMHPVVVLGPGATLLDMTRFAFAPACYRFYWAFMALTLFQLVWNSIDLVRGSWRGPQLGKHLVFKIVGLIPLLFLITVPDRMLLILKNPAVDVAKYGDLIYGINHWTGIGLTIALAMSICQIVWDAIQLFLDRYRKRAALAHND